jgi:pyridoxal phosphate enzyme (YggS family)
MDYIEKNLLEIKELIYRACQRSSRNPDDISLVAVTKLVDIEKVKRAVELGIKDIGENRVQEAEGKISGLIDLKQEITWHMIGHLQSNKVKLAVRLFDMIQSVDSIRLASILDSHSCNLPVLLEVNVSGEHSKNGFKEEELKRAMEEIRSTTGLNVKGLMTVAPLVNDAEEVRPIFRRLRKLAESLDLQHLSMGMTDDFEVAIEEGATIIRLGRAIFGERSI